MWVALTSHLSHKNDFIFSSFSFSYPEQTILISKQVEDFKFVTMILNFFLLFALVLGTLAVDETVVRNSTLPNDKALKQTIANEKVQKEGPTTSAKFQTGNVKVYNMYSKI